MSYRSIAWPLLLLFSAAVPKTDVCAALYTAGARQAGKDATVHNTAPEAARAGQWQPYAHRYAIIVMGGNVTGQMYRWYWNDTSGKLWTLMDYGFPPDNVIYLSYGDSANAHPELVDGVSNKADVKAAFDTIAAWVTSEDLVHVWWVDHGDPSGFQVHDGFVYFTELREWIDSIPCKVYVGAYNPCYSGAIMPHMAGLCTPDRWVITATSVNAAQGNSYGWAGKWRQAVRGAYASSTVPHHADVNGDGYVSIDEAYEWEAPHSLDAGEYPLSDDNCDGVGGDFSNPLTYDSSGMDPLRDGYFSQFFSLMGWYDTLGTASATSRLSEVSSSSAASTPGRTDRYDIDINWQTGASLPSGVSRGASGLIDGKIYLFGGQPTPAPVHYVYDIETDTWSDDVPPLPLHSSLTRGVVHAGMLYVLGGHTLGSDTMRCFDPASNAWTVLSAPYSGWRECCKYGAAAVGDNIFYYYMEHRYSYYPQQCFWKYDVAGNSWTEQLAPPSPKRMYVASASDGTYCYAIGGIAHDTEMSVMDEVLRHDPGTGDWETLDPLPDPVAFADGDFLNNRLYLAGGGAGFDPWPAGDRVLVWQEATDWLEATPLPQPVGCPHVEVASINDTDYIFVFGGYRDGYLNTLYIGTVVTGCCMPPIRGNADYDPGDNVNIVDLTYLVNYLFGDGPPPPCFEEGDAQADGNINIVDLTYLVEYLFATGPPPLPCPD